MSAEFTKAVPDGTFYAPGHEPVLMPPMEVRNWPSEWESQLPGGHTRPVAQLVNSLVALMEAKNETRK